MQLPTHQHGRQSTYAIRRYSGRNDHKSGPNNIHKTHMVQQTQQTNVVCATYKCPRHNSTSSPTDLENIIGDIQVVGLHNQPI